MIDLALDFLQSTGRAAAIHVFANDHRVGGGAGTGNVAPQEESTMARAGGTILSYLERKSGLAKRHAKRKDVYLTRPVSKEKSLALDPIALWWSKTSSFL